MLEKLHTDKRNQKTPNLDTLTTGEILRIMNEEDRLVPLAVERALPEIERAVAEAIRAIRAGGRLIYAGAGTSGRIGVIDAAECHPTFGVGDEVQAIMAGGSAAFLRAEEGAEDSVRHGERDINALDVGKNDVVVGVAASGRTPYVRGALTEARRRGAKAVSISCNLGAENSGCADIAIEVDCGPEILTGSTRLKAGTAQKLILNMISTATMVGLGKVYLNLMVDLNCSNNKLVERSHRIVSEATGVEIAEARGVLEQAHGRVKEAIVMILGSCTFEQASARLEKADGVVRRALEG